MLVAAGEGSRWRCGRGTTACGGRGTTACGGHNQRCDTTSTSQCHTDLPRSELGAGARIASGWRCRDVDRGNGAKTAPYFCRGSDPVSEPAPALFCASTDSTASTGSTGSNTNTNTNTNTHTHTHTNTGDLATAGQKLE